MSEYIADEVILNGVIYRRVLENPPLEDWIPTPEDWAPKAVPVDNLEKFNAHSAIPGNVDSAPCQGELRGKFPFKKYSKSIQFSGSSADALMTVARREPPRPSLLRKFWQKLADDFRIVFLG